jgi:hypothetical protein
MKKSVLLLSISLGVVLVVTAACGSTTGTNGSIPTGKLIKSAPAGNNLTVSLSSEDAVIKHGNTEFTLSFTDAAGKPVEVGAVALTFHMPQMGTMAEMNDGAKFTTTNTPGVYRGRANVEGGG